MKNVFWMCKFLILMQFPSSNDIESTYRKHEREKKRCYMKQEFWMSNNLPLPLWSSRSLIFFSSQSLFYKHLASLAIIIREEISHIIVKLCIGSDVVYCLCSWDHRFKAFDRGGGGAWSSNHHTIHQLTYGLDRNLANHWKSCSSKISILY